MTDEAWIVLVVLLAVLGWGIVSRVSRYRRCPHCGARAMTPWACPACGDDPFERGAR